MTYKTIYHKDSKKYWINHTTREASLPISQVILYLVGIEHIPQLTKSSLGTVLTDIGSPKFA